MRLPVRPRRSALYLPASNPRAIAKARTLASDMVILDLEDAVAPEAKVSARDAAAAAAGEGGFGPRELLIRANARGTEWGADDLAALATAPVDGVLVPKIDGPEDVIACDRALAAAAPGLALWVMIETCACVPQLPAIARAARDTRLAGFVLGTNDLAKEMRARITPAREAFLPIFTAAIVAARAEGLAVLDGVCNEFGDLDLFAAECTQGLTLGFDGKTLIHPAQIDPCNTVFSPSDAEIVWADKVIAAFDAPENAGRGALQVEGKMVEVLHLEQARQVRATADAIAARIG